MQQGARPRTAVGITATSLQNNASLNAHLAGFLQDNPDLSVFCDLLSLADIRDKKGEEKVLLIGDFLSSNFNVLYSDEPAEVELGNNTKL